MKRPPTVGFSSPPLRHPVLIFLQLAYDLRESNNLPATVRGVVAGKPASQNQSRGGTGIAAGQTLIWVQLRKVKVGGFGRGVTGGSRAS